MPAPSIDGILETCLYARDLPTAARFYERLLGLSPISTVEGRHAFFRCGEGVFLLFDPSRTRDEGGDVPPHGAEGPGHVAFAVDSTEVDAWRARLTAEGVVIEREVTWPSGGRSLYIRDPAGNSVELATRSIWAG